MVKKNHHKKNWIFTIVFSLILSSQLFGAIDYERLGHLSGWTLPNTTVSRCPDGKGTITTTTHREYYQNGHIDVTTTTGCNGGSSTDREPTYYGIYGDLGDPIDIDNGDVVVWLDTGSVEIFDATNMYAIRSIGRFEPEGEKIVVPNMPRRIPLVIVLMDEAGNPIASKKIIID